MKKTAIIILVSTLTILAKCYAGKKSKVPAAFPAAMSETVKAAFMKEYDKGQILWDINCSKCHNTTEGKKILVPDFKPEQLKGYELRVINPTHESDIPETSVSAEELGLIMTFLTYKTKNG